MQVSLFQRRVAIRLAAAAPAKSVSAPRLSAMVVTLDTRTTSAGNRPFTATRRVHTVEGWRCHERDHALDFTVLVGWHPGITPGGRRDGCLSGRHAVAARLAVRAGLPRRLAFHGVSPARSNRARVVAGFAPVHRPRRHNLGGAACGSRPHRRARGVLRTGLSRAGVPPGQHRALLCPARRHVESGPGRTAATRRRRPTSRTVRVDATTCSTSGGAMTLHRGGGRRC